MFSSLIGSSKEKQLEFTSEDAAAIFSKIQPRLQSKLASSSASIASTSSTTSDASFASANSFYITSSGKGVVTSDFIQSQVEKILSGSSSDVRRITLADISDKLDLDKSTVQSYVETTALKQSIYQSNGVYFTSSELDRIASSLKASITEQPYVLSVKFGISEEIDPTLVKRVTESVNHSTDWDDRILSLHGPQSETYLISEKKLLFAQEQLKEWILAQDEPFTLSSIAVSNNPSPLLSDSKLRQIVVKNFVPYFVEYKDADGKLANVSSGAVLSDSDIISLFAPSSNLSLSDFQFIPERYQKKLQQQYIDSLKSNGVIGKSIEENLQLPSIIPEPFEIDTIDDVKPDSHNDYDTPDQVDPIPSTVADPGEKEPEVEVTDFEKIPKVENASEVEEVPEVPEVENTSEVKEVEEVTEIPEVENIPEVKEVSNVPDIETTLEVKEVPQIKASSEIKAPIVEKTFEGPVEEPIEEIPLTEPTFPTLASTSNSSSLSVISENGSVSPNSNSISTPQSPVSTHSIDQVSYKPFNARQRSFSHPSISLSSPPSHPVIEPIHGAPIASLPSDAVVDQTPHELVSSPHTSPSRGMSFKFFHRQHRNSHGSPNSVSPTTSSTFFSHISTNKSSPTPVKRSKSLGPPQISTEHTMALVVSGKKHKMPNLNNLLHFKDVKAFKKLEKLEKLEFWKH